MTPRGHIRDTTNHNRLVGKSFTTVVAGLEQVQLLASREKLNRRQMDRLWRQILRMGLPLKSAPKDRNLDLAGASHEELIEILSEAAKRLLGVDPEAPGKLRFEARFEEVDPLELLSTLGIIFGLGLHHQ